jgi:hypothetical protein
MKIINKTHWRSDHIKAIAQRVALDELDPAVRKRFVVTVSYGHRGPHVSGWAYYHSHGCQVMVGSDQVEPLYLAHTLAHEMAHARGMTHKQMRGSGRYMWVPGWRDFYAWAKELPVERKVAKPRPAVAERRLKRLDNAKVLLAHWEVIHKRSATKVRKWRGRVRDLERYIARAALKPEAS